MKRLIKGHLCLFAFSLFSLLCLILLILFRALPPFAEWFATVPACGVRYLLSALTSPLPFSLFEISVGAFVLYCLYLVVLGIALLIKKIKKSPLPKGVGKRFLAAALTLLTVFDLYVFTLAPCYFRHSTAYHMELDTQGVAEEEVFLALEALCNLVNEAAPHLKLNEAGESLRPEALRTVKEKVVAAANAFGDRNGFYQSRGFAAKSFLISPLMTYTHLSGVYGFFTGEANVNTNYPHFIVTATLAHETAHARGIAPENECNFLASVILMESGDPYLAYCGAVFLADDVITTCRKLDKERTNAILSETHPVMLRDFAAYSRFFDPYRDHTAAKVADTTNSAYLKAMGQKEGTVSYSRVIRLISAYFQKEAS
ncbi:MAG: DUF3810 domain-containing protein [Clostridia bacterium]|nr:DUF3810 domain-containing protein [Clostridia bacterium]